MRKMFLRFAGLGDDLFVNTLAHQYWVEHGKKVLVAGANPTLYRGNPGAWVLPASPKTAHRVGRLLEKLNIIESMTYLEYQSDASEGGMKPLQAHILKILADRVGLSQVPERPRIFLSDEELENNALPPGDKPWVAIHSTGVSQMTENKNWYLDRFVTVAKNIRRTCRLVQLGAAGDPALEHDLDLRGKITPRKAAAVLASCSALVCQVGYLMHAAAAVGTRSVAIYGGFEAPWESGYEQNVNLFTPLDCAPCWFRYPCIYDKECMNRISVEDVLEGLERILGEC